MSEPVTIFGYAIAEIPDDLLLIYISKHCPADSLAMRLGDYFSWMLIWRSCVKEAEYRGLLALDGWAQWAKEAA